MIFKLVISGQPVAKGRVRFARKTGHAFTPEKTVAYEGRIALAAQEKMNGNPPFEGPLDVILTLHLRIPEGWSKKKRAAALLGGILPTGRPDLDNYAKILDALNLIVWVDDAQIVTLRVRKAYAEQPLLMLEVDRSNAFFA